MNPRFRTAGAAVIAVLLAGCQTQAGTPELEMVWNQQQCQPWRDQLPPRSYANLLEQCTQKLGEVYCRQCLAESRWR
jgi:hypothetical protein